MIVIERLEFELAYFEATAQHFNLTRANRSI